MTPETIIMWSAAAILVAFAVGLSGFVLLFLVDMTRDVFADEED